MNSWYTAPPGTGGGGGGGSADGSGLSPIAQAYVTHATGTFLTQAFAGDDSDLGRGQALSGAFTAAGSGSTIYLNNEFYQITSKLTLNNSVTLLGNGARIYSNNPVTLLQVNGESVLEHLTLDARSDNASSIPIFLNNRFQDSKLYSCTLKVAGVGNRTIVSISTNTSGYLYNCVLHGGIINGEPNQNYIQMYDCEFKNTTLCYNGGFGGGNLHAVDTTFRGSGAGVIVNMGFDTSTPLMGSFNGCRFEATVASNATLGMAGGTINISNCIFDLAANSTGVYGTTAFAVYNLANNTFLGAGNPIYNLSSTINSGGNVVL